MNVGELIKELSKLPTTCPAFFSRDLRTNEALPIVDVACGEDDVGETVVLTSDNNGSKA